MSLHVKDPGTFYHYMTTVVMEKDNAKGDLARDLALEVSTFRLLNPNGIDSLEKLLYHLRSRGACSECLAVARKCWHDYMREVRKWQSLEYLTKGSLPPEPYRWLGEYDERRGR